jgi:hypothetical protein
MPAQSRSFRMNARPIGSKSGRVTPGEMLTALDAAERALMVLIGNTVIPGWIRDALAIIVTPLHALLRRAGMRNGKLTVKD